MYMSPLLFTIHSEVVFKKALDETTDGEIINYDCLNKIRYADDAAILSNSEEDL